MEKHYGNSNRPKSNGAGEFISIAAREIEKEFFLGKNERNAGVEKIGKFSLFDDLILLLCCRLKHFHPTEPDIQKKNSRWGRKKTEFSLFIHNSAIQAIKFCNFFWNRAACRFSGHSQESGK